MFLVAGVECLYSAVEARRVVRWTSQPVWVRRAPASRQPLVLRRSRLPVHRLSWFVGCKLLCRAVLRGQLAAGRAEQHLRQATGRVRLRHFRPKPTEQPCGRPGSTRRARVAKRLSSAELMNRKRERAQGKI